MQGKSKHKIFFWLRFLRVNQLTDVRKAGGADHQAEEEPGASCEPQKCEGGEGGWGHVAVEADY